MPFAAKHTGIWNLW